MSRQQPTTKRQQISHEESVSSGLRKGWRGIVGMSVLLSILGFAFVAWPRLSVIPGEVFDKRNPLHTPFILRNDGYLPLSDIKFICFLRNATLSGSNKPFVENVGFSLANTRISRLGANESASITFDRIIGQVVDFASADIDVLVTYRPFLMPFKTSDSQGFKTKENYNGELVWILAPNLR